MFPASSLDRFSVFPFVSSKNCDWYFSISLKTYSTYMVSPGLNTASVDRLQIL